MATSDGFLCGVCEYQNITIPAEHWCPECDEGLCSSCENHHRSSRLSRKHGVMSIENYKKLPSGVVKVTNHCEEHGSKYQNYCPRHDKLCCPICISTTHKECIGLLAIEKIIETSKMTSLLDNMEDTLKCMNDNISSIIQNRADNLSLIREQRDRYRDNIAGIRKSVIFHLDALEGQIVKELYDEEEKSKTAIEALTLQLEEKSRTIESLRNNIAAMKEFASPLQTFIGSKTIEEKVNKEEDYMMSLSQNESLRQIQLNLSIDNKITDVVSSISSLGTVNTETSPPLLTFMTGKEKQAQIICDVQKSLEDINITFEFDIDLSTQKLSVIRGCYIMPSGEIILTSSRNNRLVVLKEDGIFSKEISDRFANVNDVSAIDDRTVALTGGNSIYIVDIEAGKIVRKINANGRCEGIHYDKGSLFVCVNGKGIQRIQLQTDSRTTLIKQERWKGWSFITSYGENIYQTDSNNCTVACYNIQGEKLWVFEDKSAVLCPLGVDVDGNGNVYVASNYNHRVMVLSPDGKKFRQLLGDDDGLWNPSAINIDVNSRKLLVFNYSAKAFLYKIS